MAFKKYELKVIFTIDDSVESAVEDIKDMQKEIRLGIPQKDLIKNEGFTNAIVTLKEIK